MKKTKTDVNRYNESHDYKIDDTLYSFNDDLVNNNGIDKASCNTQTIMDAMIEESFKKHQEEEYTIHQLKVIIASYYYTDPKKVDFNCYLTTFLFLLSLSYLLLQHGTVETV